MPKHGYFEEGLQNALFEGMKGKQKSHEKSAHTRLDRKRCK